MKILLVDDSPAEIRLMESILVPKYLVETCLGSSGVEEKAINLQPNLILLDVVMPNRSGYEVLRSLKRHKDTKHIHVIMVSSKGEETDIIWGKRQGASDYIVKPYTKDTVLKTISKYL